MSRSTIGPTTWPPAVTGSTGPRLVRAADLRADAPADLRPLDFLIPTKNRATSLARTLASVLPAARRAGAGVLICDQSSTPFTAPPGVTVLHRPDLSGLPAARNVLLAASRAAVVCFLDDDVDVGGDLGVRLIALAAAEPTCAGWGPVVETRPTSVRRLHRLAQLGVFRDPRRLTARRCDQPTTALFGCCFAVRRAAAVAVGFDARRPGYALGEDLDFFRRLRHPLRFVAALRVVHRRDGADRADPVVRGVIKARFLLWLAHRHGHGDPATPLHLVLALAAAAWPHGQEAASWRGLATGLLGRR